MDTRYITYALEIESTGSISRAAANLYMAQPNLSKCLKELENELGYQIFQRTASGVKVTEKGTEFLYHARKLVEQIDKIHRIAYQDLSESNRYKLSVPRGSYIVDGFTSMISEITFRDRMEITIHETNSANTIDNVADKSFNLGIIRVSAEDEEYFKGILRKKHLVSEAIWEFEYVLVMSQDHPLVHKAVIYETDLDPYIKITHADLDRSGDHGETAEAHEGTGRRSGRTICVYERGSQFDLLTKVPETYMWVSPIPKAILERNHLVQRTCQQVHHLYKDILIYREDYRLGDYDRLFRKKLWEARAEVSAQDRF